MRRIIIDTDIGTYYDDAFAVLLAAQSPELKLEGVTTVYGDTILRAKIARKVLNIAGKSEIPVFSGCGKPLKGNALMFGWEGANILDTSDESLKPSPGYAIDFIVDCILANPDEITVITLGALTNIAVALAKEPNIAKKIQELIIMGGVIVPVVDQKGIRRSPIEEYNLNNDPVAAEIVFNSGAPITLVPIDVTLKVPLKPEQIALIRATNKPVPKLVSNILDAWPEQERQIYLSVGIPTEFTGIWLHDPLTVGVSIDRTFVTTARLHVDVEYAPTPIDRDLLIRNDILRTIPKKKEPNTDVAVDVQAERFTEFFTQRIIT